MDLKEKIIHILTPVFGEEVKKIIEDNYTSKKPEELVQLAYHMLSGYMGEQNAKKLLQKVLKDNPKIQLIKN
jgi:hypothetical protein